MAKNKPSNTKLLSPLLQKGVERGSSFPTLFGGGREGAHSFFDKVYEVTRLIPPGRVTSYGAIAAYLGTKQSSRMVGWALNNSHGQDRFVPAHRVVNRNGLLTAKHHFGTSSAMQELLEAEGITIIDDQIIDFEKHFWDPMIELDLG